MNKFYIYCIHNTLNNKMYVGKTSNLKKRWSSHKSCSKRVATNQYVHRAIKKYGEDNFTFSVIHIVSSKQECREAEIYWISFFNSTNSNFGYNLTKGGDGSWGRKQTQATRKKISESKKNTMVGLNNPFYGMTHTEKSKQKIRFKNLGRKRSNNTCKKMSQNKLGDKNNFYGRKHSIESKNKMRENGSGVKLNRKIVCKIIQSYRSGLYTQKIIGQMYNISQTHVSRIINGKQWVEFIGDK